jgi:serine protease Do
MKFFDKVRSQKLLSFTLILFTLSIGVVIGTLINTGVKAAKDGPVAPGATALVIPSPVQLSNEFTKIAKQLEPSVVNISTTYLPKPQAQTRRRARPTPQDEEGDDNGMQDFFNRFFGGNPFGGMSPDGPQRKSQALGSGVVVDKAGYVLTNNHVVDKADRIQVKFANDTAEYDAKVVGVDAQTDLAVLRVEGKREFVPARIGNSDAVQVGDWAIAIGSPFGFQATVTAGIISAKERDIPGEASQYQHFLQTDAAINPGNSGGPLLNIRGEIIGINTAIATRSGGYQGIGFALPVNTAVRIYNDIIKTGKVTRGSIGISFPSDPETSRNLLKAYGATEGVFVQEVAAGGPSEKAGLKTEDVIVAVNGKPIKNGNELVEIISTTPVGTPVTLTVLREKKRQDFKVVIGDLTQVFADRFGGGKKDDSHTPDGEQAKFGMYVETIPSSRRQTLGLKVEGGVLITKVDTNSFAEDVGLQQRDLLLSINRQPVNSVDDVRRIQSTLKPGDAVAFRIMRQFQRGGEWTSQFLAGTLPSQQ